MKHREKEKEGSEKWGIVGVMRRGRRWRAVHRVGHLQPRRHEAGPLAAKLLAHHHWSRLGRVHHGRRGRVRTRVAAVDDFWGSSDLGREWLLLWTIHFRQSMSSCSRTGRERERDKERVRE